MNDKQPINNLQIGMVLCLYRLHISDLSNTYMDTCKQQPLISSHLLNIVCICFRIASLINNLSSVSYKIYCLYIHLCYFLLFLGKSKSKNTTFVIWCSILAIFFQCIYIPKILEVYCDNFVK